MPVSFTQTANPAGVAASSTVATYSGVSIGTADNNRVVVVLVGTELAGANASACTIDGVAMNRGSTAGDFAAMQADCFWLHWPSGTTATIAVTFSSVSPGATANHIAVYRAVGGVVSGNGGDGSTDMDATDALTTGSITIASNGGFIAVAVGATDTVAKTWTNATEDLDIDAGTFRFTTATRTTSGTVTITCQGTTNAEDGALSYLLFVEGTNFAATGIGTGAPTVGTPVLEQIISAVNFTADGIATGAPTVGTPAITQSHSLTATGIATGAPTVGSPSLAVSAFQSDAFQLDAFQIYDPPAGSVVDLTATGITATPVVGTPALTQAHSLTATGVTTTPTVGSPALTQAHALTATGVATGAPTVGAPAITQAHALAATGVATGAPTVGSPALTQAHILTAAGIVASPTVGAPAITQSYSLTATGITASPTVGSPALTQGHALAATGIASGAPTVGSPALTQAHTLSATGIAATPTVGSPAITQAHVLTAAGIETGAPTVGTPVLTKPGELAADSLSTGEPTVGTPQIWQVHTLVADGVATGAPSLGSPLLPVAARKDDPGDWQYNGKNRKRLIKLAQLRELVAKEEKEIEFLIANGYL